MVTLPAVKSFLKQCSYFYDIFIFILWNQPRFFVRTQTQKCFQEGLKHIRNLSRLFEVSEIGSSVKAQLGYFFIIIWAFLKMNFYDI